jgi:hypothetical protein
MHRIIAAIAFVMLGGSALSQTPSETKQIEYEKEHAEIVTMFRTETGFEEIDRGEVLQFIDNKRTRVFLVTKPGHPAHPSVVTRQAIEQDGNLFIKSNGVGRGDKQALKIWIDYPDSEVKRAVDQSHEKRTSNDILSTA